LWLDELENTARPIPEDAGKVNSGRQNPTLKPSAYSNFRRLFIVIPHVSTCYGTTIRTSGNGGLPVK
jgi:hypothetical protein